jgi:hypothetical protein
MNAAVDRASGSQRPESGCMRDGLHRALRPQSHLASAGVVLRRTAQRRARALARARARERACQSWRRCHLGRPAARDTTMPPMTGPEHYQRAEQLLTEASELIRFRQQPGQSGPADLPVRPRTRNNGSGCPATPAARTGASPKPRFMPPSPWPPPPRSPAWARTAGRGPMLPEPSSAADNSRRRDRHPPAGLPPNGPRSQTQPQQIAAARRWRHARPVVTSIADRPSLHCAMSGLPGRQGEQSSDSGNGARRYLRATQPDHQHRSSLGCRPARRRRRSMSSVCACDRVVQRASISGRSKRASVISTRVPAYVNRVRDLGRLSCVLCAERSWT